MPIIEIKHLPLSSKLGVWKIEEKAEELVALLQLDDKEMEYITTLNNNKRYLHWLSSRVMLRQLLETNEFIVFKKDERGKPVVGNFPHEVSIAHSHEMAAVLVSEEVSVGVDIEIIDEKVFRVAHKFLSEKEKNMIDPAFQTEQLMLGWCAKEALFKLYGKGQVDFINNLFLDFGPFTEIGTIQGRIHKDNHKESYTVFYEKLGEYMLCYVTGKPIEG